MGLSYSNYNVTKRHGLVYANNWYLSDTTANMELINEKSIHVKWRRQFPDQCITIFAHIFACISSPIQTLVTGVPQRSQSVGGTCGLVEYVLHRSAGLQTWRVAGWKCLDLRPVHWFAHWTLHNMVHISFRSLNAAIHRNIIQQMTWMTLKGHNTI